MVAVAQQELSFEAARRARIQLATWIVTTYVRLGEISVECTDDRQRAVAQLRELAQCSDAFKSLMAMSDEEIAPEVTRLEHKLRVHEERKKAEKRARAEAYRKKMLEQREEREREMRTMKREQPGATTDELVANVMGGSR